jgi:hypothetical protein
MKIPFPILFGPGGPSRPLGGINDMSIIAPDGSGEHLLDQQ